MTYFLEKYNVKIGAAVKTNIREELFDKVLDLGPGYIMDQRSGKLQSVLMDGVENLEPYLVGFLPQIIAVAIVGSILGIVSFWLDPVVGMIIYAFMNAQYIDAIQGITTLKAFHSSMMGMSGSGKSTLTHLLFRFYDIQKGTIRINGIDIREFDLEYLRQHLSVVFQENYLMQGSIADNIRIQKLFDEEPEVKDTGAEEKGSDQMDIEFRNVSFAYEKGKEVLHNVSFRVPYGKQVALVGPSGAGKTTCASLLLRYWDAADGEILNGGQNSQRLKLDALRNITGAVLQDVYLFHISVMENIRMGRRNAPILILDEAVSSLDAENEHLIEDFMKEHAVERTTMVIAHRLSTIRNADWLVVIKDGRVVQQGTHEALMKEEGFYRSLMQNQFSGKECV